MARKKTRTTLSIDPVLLEELKENTESVSSLMERFARQYLEMQGDDEQKLIARKERVKEKIESNEEKINELKEENRELRGELQSIEKQLQSIDRQKEVIDKAVQNLAQEVDAVREDRIKKKVKNLSTTKRFHQYLDQVEISSDELQRKIIEEVEA